MLTLVSRCGLVDVLHLHHRARPHAVLLVDTHALGGEELVGAAIGVLDAHPALLGQVAGALLYEPPAVVGHRRCSSCVYVLVRAFSIERFPGKFLPAELVSYQVLPTRDSHTQRNVVALGRHGPPQGGVVQAPHGREETGVRQCAV